MPERVGVHARVAALPVPYVPCRKERCATCGHEIWIQQGMRMDRHICTVCWLSDLEGDHDIQVTEETRQQLRELGWTDEQIDRGLRKASRQHDEVQRAGGLM